ncbi:energy-coupling factor ABC transporter ATP-binding protein [Indiicoccus explosivorum]|uniref:energy-coupling factor ABC transporter ATP-binding protein n=1 Tax=Indiicoccus explosivorum TaxID=1917864 RepID=UPI000B449505|nr:ABC transporter ATP-binding protein [Indiicoccus explosivorum]
MTEIRLKGVSFAYPDGTKALEDLELTVRAGERVAIAGQNGAGKTTAVKLMNGLLRPTEGTVEVGDWDTKDRTTAQLSKKVGYVFQNPDDQIFHNEVIDEVRFGPKNMGFDEARTDELTAWAIGLCGIVKHGEENPYNLPYSMRKFVTVASVIAMDGDVVIMDEPTAGQDQVGLAILKDVLDELGRRGKTVITITHDMEFVAEHFDRLVIMANRRIIADGPASELFSREAVLKESMLKPPSAAIIAQSLGLPEGIIRRKQLEEHILAREPH